MFPQFSNTFILIIVIYNRKGCIFHTSHKKKINNKRKKEITLWALPPSVVRSDSFFAILWYNALGGFKVFPESSTRLRVFHYSDPWCLSWEVACAFRHTFIHLTNIFQHIHDNLIFHYFLSLIIIIQKAKDTLKNYFSRIKVDLLLWNGFMGFNQLFLHVNPGIALVTMHASKLEITDYVP